jgi:hypothetical protein
MEKKLLNEINQMKFLFGYKPGKVLSEQEKVEYSEMEEDILEPVMDFDTEEEIDFEPEMMFDGPEVAPAPTREKETEKEKTEKPSRPSRPDRDPSRMPNPNVDPHPQGKRRRMRDMEDRMDLPRRRRMSDMDETIYEIDDDIEELFNK